MALARVRDTLGPIDILVNNADIAERAPFSKLEEVLWDRTIAVNPKGAYSCTRAVIGGMLACRTGHIISVASVAGRVGFAYTPAYAQRSTGFGFTRAVALEVARKRIKAKPSAWTGERVWLES